MKASRLAWVGMTIPSLLIACRPEAAEPPPPVPGGGPVVLVQAVNGDSLPEPDLKAALAGAAAGAEVSVSAGVFVVNNPLVLDVPRLLLRGSGATTIIRPRNPGRPLFLVRADGVGIEDLAIVGRSADGEGRATFAVEYEGCRGCRLSNAIIVGTGATSVIGSDLRDFYAVGNRILDAGDDAFYLKGRVLRLTDNTAVRFLDEGVDISESEDVIVRGNCVASGRIGIAMTVEKGVVNDNIVEDAIVEGIGLHSPDGRAVASGNAVSHVRYTGIQLTRPRLVSRNRLTDIGRTGIAVNGMQDGIVQENTIRDAETGFVLRQVSRSQVLLNRYDGGSSDAFRHEGGGGNVLQGNTFGPSPGEDAVGASDGVQLPNPFASHSVRRGTCLDGLTSADTELLAASLAHRLTAPAKITADNPRDRTVAEHVLEHWRENNPGILSVEVRGPVMTTEITADLWATLRASGMEAIGIVRAPARLFRAVKDSYDVEWHLVHQGTHVATVRPTQEGAGASLTFE